MTLFVSSNAKDWEQVAVVYGGPAAYSSLLFLPDADIRAPTLGSLLCAYERGDAPRFGWDDYASELALSAIPDPRTTALPVVEAR